MNISAGCIRTPLPAIMLFVLLTLGGIYCFKMMKIQNFPDLDFPTVSIMASLPGPPHRNLRRKLPENLKMR